MSSETQYVCAVEACNNVADRVLENRDGNTYHTCTAADHVGAFRVKPRAVRVGPSPAEAMHAAVTVFDAVEKPGPGVMEVAEIYAELQPQATGEIAELRAYADRCSEAIGVFYEWDGGWRRGEIEHVERAIREVCARSSELHDVQTRITEIADDLCGLQIPGTSPVEMLDAIEGLANRWRIAAAQNERSAIQATESEIPF